jgi:hypothetical protein
LQNHLVIQNLNTNWPKPIRCFETLIVSVVEPITNVVKCGLTGFVRQ